MDLDVNGNPHITGFYDSQTSHFGNITFTNGASGEYLVVKFDLNGNALWASLGCGPGYRSGTSICVDVKGISYVAGNNIYFSKIDNTGVCIGSDSAAVSVYDMHRDNSGCVYISGYIDKPTDFGSFNITPKQSQQMVIAKYCNDAQVGVEEYKKNNVFSVCPNPASNIINLSFEATIANNYAITIKNMLGQIIFSESVRGASDAFTKQIDLSSTPKGIYFIELQSNPDKSVVKKIVLQ